VQIVSLSALETCLQPLQALCAIPFPQLAYKHGTEDSAVNTIAAGVLLNVHWNLCNIRDITLCYDCVVIVFY